MGVAFRYRDWFTIREFPIQMRYQPLWQQSGASFAFERSSADQRLLIVVNRGKAAFEMATPILNQQPELIFGTLAVSNEPQRLRLRRLPAGSAAILRLNQI